MQTHYQSLDGEATVRRLVDRFYDLMDAFSQTADFMRNTDG